MPQPIRTCVFGESSAQELQLSGLDCDSQAGGVPSAANQAGVWLAAYTRPRHEQQVRQYCEDRGFEVFLPTYQSWRRWSDRKKLLALPLFPSYIFLRLTDADRSRVVQAPGLLWFVHNRTGPVAVDGQELLAIRRLLTSGLQFDPLPGVQVGDEVEIIAGALRGCRGFLLRKDGGAIVLRVSAVDAGVRVHLPDPSWVVPVRAPRPTPRSLPAAVPLSFLRTNS